MSWMIPAMQQQPLAEWSEIRVRIVRNDELKRDVFHFEVYQPTGAANGDTYIGTMPVSSIKEIIRVKGWPMEKTEALYNVLLPKPLQQRIGELEHIIWKVDKYTDPFPWEMLVKNKAPLCICKGMIRRPVTDERRHNFQTHDPQNNTLVITSSHPENTGAYFPEIMAEGGLVENILKQASYTVVSPSPASAAEILMALFSSSYKIVHLTGQGYFNPDPVEPPGIVIGKDARVTVNEFAQMSRLPELVFISCGYRNFLRSEDIHESSSYEFSAAMGLELIELGVEAVVVIEYIEHSEAAFLFITEFYRQLLANEMFGIAVTNARKAVFSKYGIADNTWGDFRCYGDHRYRLKKIPEITISNQEMLQSSIQIWKGEAFAIPEPHFADLLVIFGDDQSKLFRAGPSNHTLICNDADNLEITVDHAHHLPDGLECWISRPLTEVQSEQFNFGRLLYISGENTRTASTDIASWIFRCLHTYAYDKSVNRVIIPLLDKYRKQQMKEIVSALFEYSIFWLDRGLPLSSIKFIASTEKQMRIALSVAITSMRQYNLLRQVRQKTLTAGRALQILHQGWPGTDEPSMIPESTIMPAIEASIKDIADPSPDVKRLPSPEEQRTQEENPSGYHFFLSYAHKNAVPVSAFYESLMKDHKQLRIFFDKKEIASGSLWLKKINDAIEQSSGVLIFASPDYANSPICWDEFQCAKLQEYRTQSKIINVIYLHDFKENEMPLMIAIHSYEDCREGDIDKLNKFAHQLILEHAHKK